MWLQIVSKLKRAHLKRLKQIFGCSPWSVLEMHLYSHCCCARDLLQATGVLGYFEVQLQQGKAEKMTSFLRISLEPKDLSSFWFC
jgi:hypothetical protein